MMLRTLVSITIIANAIIVARDGLFGTISRVKCLGEEQVEQQATNSNNKSESSGHSPDIESITSDNTLIQPMFFNPIPIAAPLTSSPYAQQGFNPATNSFYVIQPNAVMYNNNKRRRRQRNRPLPAASKMASPNAIPFQVAPFIAPITPYTQLIGPIQGINQVPVVQRLPNQIRGSKIYIRQVSANKKGSKPKAVSVHNVRSVLVPLDSKRLPKSSLAGSSSIYPDRIVYPVSAGENFAAKSRHTLKPAYVESEDMPNSSKQKDHPLLIRPGQVLFSETDQYDSSPKLSLKDVEDIELLLRRLKPLVNMSNDSEIDQPEVAQRNPYQVYRRPIIVSASVEQQVGDINYPIENQIFIAGLKHPGRQRNVNKDELAFLTSLAQLKSAETDPHKSKTPDDEIAEKFYSNRPANHEADNKRPIPVETLVDQLMSNTRLARFGGDRAHEQTTNGLGVGNSMHDTVGHVPGIDDEVIDPSSGVEGVSATADNEDDDEDDDDDEYLSDDNTEAESSPDYIVTRAPSDVISLANGNNYTNEALPRKQVLNVTNFIPSSFSSILSDWKPLDSRPAHVQSVSDQVSEDGDEENEEDDEETRKKPDAVMYRRKRREPTDSGLVIGDRKISRLDLIRLITIVSKMGSSKSKSQKERRKIKKLLRFLVRVALENFKQDQLRLDKESKSGNNKSDQAQSKYYREPLRSLLTSPKDEEPDVDDYKNSTYKQREKVSDIGVSKYPVENSTRKDDESHELKEPPIKKDINREPGVVQPVSKERSDSDTKNKLSNLSGDLKKYLDSDFFEDLGDKIENAGENFNRTDEIKHSIEKDDADRTKQVDLSDRKQRSAVKRNTSTSRESSNISEINAGNEYEPRHPIRVQNHSKKEHEERPKMMRRRPPVTNEQRLHSPANESKGTNQTHKRRPLMPIVEEDESEEEGENERAENDSGRHTGNSTNAIRIPAAGRRPSVIRSNGINHEPRLRQIEDNGDTSDQDKLIQEDDDDDRADRQLQDHQTASRNQEHIASHDGPVDSKPSKTAELNRSLVGPIIGQRRKSRREYHKRIIEQDQAPEDEPVDRDVEYYESRDEIPAPILANRRHEARRNSSRYKRRQKKSSNNKNNITRHERRYRKRDPDREYSGSSRVEADNRLRVRRKNRPKRPEAVDESYGNSDNDEHEYNDHINPSSLDPSDGDNDGDPVAHVVEGTSYSGVCEDDGNCQVTLKSNNPKLGKAIKSRDEPSIARHLNKWMDEEDENK